MKRTISALSFSAISVVVLIGCSPADPTGSATKSSSESMMKEDKMMADDGMKMSSMKEDKMMKDDGMMKDGKKE